MDSVLEGFKKQIIEKRDDMLQILDVRYSCYVTHLLQQKMLIVDKIQKLIDQQIMNINHMLQSHCWQSNQQILNTIESIINAQFMDLVVNNNTNCFHLSNENNKNNENNESCSTIQSDTKVNAIVHKQITVNNTDSIDNVKMKNKQPPIVSKPNMTSDIQIDKIPDSLSNTSIPTINTTITQHENKQNENKNKKKRKLKLKLKFKKKLKTNVIRITAHNQNMMTETSKERKTHVITDLVSLRIGSICAKCYRKSEQKSIIKCCKCFRGYHLNCIQGEKTPYALCSEKHLNKLKQSHICQICKEEQLNSRRSIRLKNKTLTKANKNNLRHMIIQSKHQPQHKKHAKPSYRFMILDALDKIGSPTGLSKQLIADYIDTNYGLKYGLATGSQFIVHVSKALSAAIQAGLIETLTPGNKLYKCTVCGQQLIKQKRKLLMENSIPALIRYKEDNNPKAYTYHMSIHDAKQLRINDLIDYRDSLGRFLVAVIVHIGIGRKLKVRYVRFGDEVWTDYKTELCRIARYKSVSKRQKYRFLQIRKGDFMDILPGGTCCKEWTIGEIVKFDTYSGQIKFVYNDANGYQYWWIHSDNEKELQPLQTKQLKSKPDMLYDDMISDVAKNACLSTYHTDMQYIKVTKSIPYHYWR